MPLIPYNKLVRDKIPEIIISQGNTPEIETLNQEDFSRELDKKLLEETNEYLSSGSIAELADVFQVILTIICEHGITFDQFETLRLEIAAKCGEFNKRVFLSQVIINKRG